MSILLAPRGSAVFPRSAEREISSPERAYCFATRLHHVKGAGKRAAARQQRMASQLVCTGGQIHKSKFPDKTLFYYKMCRSFRQAQTPPRLPPNFPKFVEKPQTQDIVTVWHGNNKMQEMHRKTRSNAAKREENGIFGTLQTVIQRV